MTEAGWITAGNWNEHIQDDSVGRALPGFSLKAVGENGSLITEKDAFGDILVKSSALMLGYIDNDAATNEAFDRDGWLRTGDVGQVMDGGKVYVVDRKKDLIKVRGWQVSPAEVENVIIQHPLVEDAAVIGIELPNNTGEIPIAYVIARPGESLDTEALKSWAQERLSKYKIPEQIILTESIPKNPTGKILRRILRERTATHQEDKAETELSGILSPTDSEARPLANAIFACKMLVILVGAAYLWYSNLQTRI
jgi:acyl-CoA synthetase (AMP-forming)/AMP-acid ligase II